ncbi:LacI family DNA-binding transcriptional regulator [Glaciihabitans sp. INWT7]|uniref:LacI family DNA-binding transcriptional regulator n=1 Tax=Glaciihabitans sp. INWT7 TaxID=2596912 RepID=UPI001C63CE5F|nr:LacI family DNA-binding transcriptional regulator [Glaciihabitans sp. INWT7]
MANIMEVARLAGVSHQTVSRVLNNENTVRPQTRAKVEAAIRELRYRPSSVARALATRKTRTLGLVSTGNPLYGPASIALAFNGAAREAGYQVITASMAEADRDEILQAIDVLLRQQVEAIVLVASDHSSIEAIDGLELDTPLVTADSSGHGSFPSVSIDQFCGAELATAHLADLGHRDILHLAGPEGSLDARERERGWRSELARRGLPVHEPLHGDWTADSGRSIGEHLIAAGMTSAIFVANDQMTLGLLHALDDHGIAVPAEVSIVGFDDIPEAAHFSPPLSTIRQDFTELGRRIMGTVSSVLDGRVLTDPVKTAPHLVERESAIRR